MAFQTGSRLLALAVQCLALRTEHHGPRHPGRLLQWSLGILRRLSTQAGRCSRYLWRERRHASLSRTRQTPRTALATCCGFVAVLAGAVALDVLAVATATAALVTIDSGAYQGKWCVDGAWHQGLVTLDLSSGTHQLTVAYNGG